MEADSLSNANNAPSYVDDLPSACFSSRAVGGSSRLSSAGSSVAANVREQTSSLHPRVAQFLISLSRRHLLACEIYYKNISDEMLLGSYRVADYHSLCFIRCRAAGQGRKVSDITAYHDLVCLPAKQQQGCSGKYNDRKVYSYRTLAFRCQPKGAAEGGSTVNTRFLCSFVCQQNTATKILTMT